MKHKVEKLLYLYYGRCYRDGLGLDFGSHNMIVDHGFGGIGTFIQSIK